jgi:hypothetical protein
LIRCLSILAASAMLTACFEIEHAVELREDLSGELTTRATVDLEQARRYDLWNGGMREDADLPDMNEFCRTLAEENARVAALLPPGTKLAVNTCETTATAAVVRRRFTFDHLSKLPPLLAFGVGGFGGIRLHAREEGGTWLLSAAGEDLGILDNLQDLMPQDESEQAQAEAFRVRGSFRLTAAPEIGQHNAHRKDGKTLVWQYDSLHPPAGRPEILVSLTWKAKS